MREYYAMDVLVIGPNGKTGKLLIPILLANGHRVGAMIRDESQGEDMRALGAEPLAGDLEASQAELAAVVRGHDAVIFAAGSGSKTGPEKTVDVDQNGAITLIDACRAADCRRFIMLSSMATGAPERAPEKLHPYLAAKGIADKHLSASGLDYTIARPGLLTDEPATGRIRTADSLGNIIDAGKISRADTAHILAACLDHPNTIGASFEALAGDTEIEAAMAGL